MGLGARHQQEAQLPQRDGATLYVSKFVLLHELEVIKVSNSKCGL